MQNFLTQLTALLSKDERLVGDGKLLKNKIAELALKLDAQLIELLLSEQATHDMFFVQAGKVTLFDQDKFLKFVSSKQFLPDSYTAFRNKIGLTVNNDYLTENKQVVLSWPYKDTILEGGQTKADAKRDEIFWNQILAPDQISRLFEPKVISSAKRINGTGEFKLEEFKVDDRKRIKDNLIIRGNNLLALHSLKKRFAGEIKLIYIDPPYNIGGDDFNYNDRFNHSTWLTFMKNRLEVALELLSNDGAIFVQIDHHEVGYLNVLMNEIFGPENKIQQISIKTASPAGFKTVNPGPIDVTEYLLFYTKSRKDFSFKRAYTAVDYDENYNLFIENIEDHPGAWRLRPLRDVVYEANGIKLGKNSHESNKNARAKWGEFWKDLRYRVMAQFALENAERIVSVRDPHKPSTRLKEALAQSSLEKDKIFVFRKQEIEAEQEIESGPAKEAYLYNGGALSFYSNKLQNIDGETRPTVLLTDFWSDLEWSGIAKEGGVKLKNGKKPEALIKRIIEISCDNKDDIILDFFLGSGTTCAVAHKMGFNYIGVEQIEYGENDSVVRLSNVINGDQSGISKAIGWEGGGEFVYLELAKWNQMILEHIMKAKTQKEIDAIWATLKESFQLSYEADVQSIDASAKEFAELSIEDKKKFLFKAVDQNHLYINYSDMDDEEYQVSDFDKKVSREFYSD